MIRFTVAGFTVHGWNGIKVIFFWWERLSSRDSAVAAEAALAKSAH
jgi:hypothetical protein